MTADTAIKEPCRAATTANITLSGLQTIDGIALAASDRVLVRAQSSAVANGIYTVAAGAWPRATDFDGAGEVVGGTQTLVTSGTALAGSSWRVTGNGAITIGSSAINFGPAVDSESVAFQQSGSGVVARTAEGKLREAALSPEDFGAVGDGTTNDAAAFIALIAAAQSLGAPIRLRQSAVYGLGAASWTGIAVTPMTKDLVIEGNRATIKLLALPTQGNIGSGGGNPIFKLEGSTNRYRLTVSDLKFDLNGIAASCFGVYQCRLDVSGCYFTGYKSFSGPLSHGVFARDCSGRLVGNRARTMSFLFYLGHTDPNMHCFDLWVAGNEGSDLGADFIMGCMKNSAISGNRCEGMLSGVGLSSASGTFSENVTITNNVFSAGTGHGVQSDVYGDNVKNIAIVGNVFFGFPVNRSPVYLYKVTGFTVAGNTIVDSARGVGIYNSEQGSVAGNRMSAGTLSATAQAAINLNGQLGDASDIAIAGNSIEGFEVGIMIGGAPDEHLISRITVTGNTTRDGPWGMLIRDNVEDLLVDANSCFDHSVLDIDNQLTNGLAGIRFGKNSFVNANGIWFTATWDPPSLANGAQQSTTVTATGAAIGDFAEVTFGNALSGTRMWAEVTAANTVTVYHRNDTGGAVNLASGTLRVEVTRK